MAVQIDPPPQVEEFGVVWRTWFNYLYKKIVEALNISTDEIVDSAVTTVKIADSNITAAKINTTSLNPIVQIVRTDDGEVATGTTVTQNDDTIPQITEGDEYITVSITPKATTNKLIIEYGAYISSTSIIGSVIGHASFQDSTNNALSANSITQAEASGSTNVNGSYEMAAGTTSSTTFRLRIGSNNSGTTTFNGIGGSRRLSGVSGSYIKVTEVLQ